MKRTVPVCLFCLSVLAASFSTCEGQCTAAHVKNVLRGGNWEITELGDYAEGYIHGLRRVEEGIAFDGGPAYQVGPVVKPQQVAGQTWCTFQLDGKPARLRLTERNRWVFELGPQNDPKRTRLFRRIPDGS